MEITIKGKGDNSQLSNGIELWGLAKALQNVAALRLSTVTLRVAKAKNRNVLQWHGNAGYAERGHGYEQRCIDSEGLVLWSFAKALCRNAKHCTAKAG